MPNTTTIDIVRAAWQDQARLIPALFGPPRRGKTWNLKQAAIQYTGDPTRVKVINPALDLPEDIGGVLRVNDHGQAYYTPPWVFPSEWPEIQAKDPDAKFVVIIDEIDKATNETLCTLLTMLSHERRVRDTRLPVGLRIAVAGNEPQSPLPEPLIGRLLLLRYPSPEDVTARLADYDSLTTTGGLNWLPGVARQVLTTPSVALPVRVSGDDSISALASWLQWAPAADPAVRSRLLEGLFRREDVPTIQNILEKDDLDADHFGEWLQHAPAQVLVNRLHRKVQELGAGGTIAAIAGLSQRASSDESGEFKRVLDALLQTPEALAGLGPNLSSVLVARAQKAWAEALNG